MAESNKKIVQNIQKAAIALCALATVFAVSSATFAKHKDNTKAKIACTAGAILSGLGLGMSLKGYLSNPYRKKERN